MVLPGAGETYASKRAHMLAEDADRARERTEFYEHWSKAPIEALEKKIASLRQLISSLDVDEVDGELEAWKFAVLKSIYEKRIQRSSAKSS